MRAVLVAARERFADLVAGAEHPLPVLCAHPEKFQLFGVAVPGEGSSVWEQQFKFMRLLVVKRLLHHFQTQRGFQQFLIRDAHEWIATGWRRAPAPATSLEWKPSAASAARAWSRAARNAAWPDPRLSSCPTV